jgi:arylsulfatase A-like enzyme
LDVLPTLCDLAGVNIPEDLLPELEGFSLRPLLETDRPVAWHEDRLLFQHVARWPAGLAASHKYTMCGVRQGHYLLIRSRPCDDPACREQLSQCIGLQRVVDGGTRLTYTKENAQFHWGVTPPEGWALFDTKTDPACQHDLAAVHPELVSTLTSAYDSWWDEVFPEMIRHGGDKGKFRPLNN